MRLENMEPGPRYKTCFALKESYDDYIETPLADWVNNELSKYFPSPRICSNGFKFTLEIQAYAFTVGSTI